MINTIYFNSFYNKWVNNNDLALNLYYNMKLLFFPLYGLISPLFILIGPFFFIKCVFKMNISFKIYWKLVSKMYFSGAGIFSFMDQFVSVYETSKKFNKQSGGNQSILNKIINIIIQSTLLI